MGNGGEVARVARIARISHDRVNGGFRGSGPSDLEANLIGAVAVQRGFATASLSTPLTLTLTFFPFSSTIRST